MSLLLDALKKAADEKKKNINISSNVENSKISDHNLNESMELEIDQTDSLDSKTISNITAEDQDDFPQVDKSVILKPAENLKETTPDETNNNTPDKGLTKNESEQATAASITEIAITPTEPVIINLEIEEQSTPEETAEDNNAADLSAAKVEEKITAENNIKHEQALSALINKSNQYSRKELFKRNISIVILITLILIGSFLYFFIEMNTATQDIYITDNSIGNNNQPTPATYSDTPAKYNNTKTIFEKKSSSKSTSSAKTTFIPKAKKLDNTNITKNPDKKTKSVNFTRTKKPDPILKLLKQAYADFYNKNYEQSETLYNMVLKREEKNRDALLGLAAIAIKQQRYEYARQKYSYILKLNPRDNIAIAGLSSIAKQTNPQLSESKLKFMLKNKPDSDHLHFALGTLYSKQNKWPEAQASYFSAWSANSKNADYAFNLAVCLDHMDKKKQALKFYQLSLKLKQASDANFSTENVERRISILQKSVR